MSYLMKNLHNVSFRVQMGCGLDLWRIFGEDSFGKSYAIGTPESYTKNPEVERGFVVTTISGSVWYLILSDSCKLEEFEKDLNECISNNGFRSI